MDPYPPAVDTMTGGVRIRAGAPADLDAIARLHTAARSAYYRGSVSDEVLADPEAAARRHRILSQRMYDPQCTVLCAETAGGLAGFAILGPPSTSQPRTPRGASCGRSTSARPASARASAARCTTPACRPGRPRRSAPSRWTCGRTTTAPARSRPPRLAARRRAPPRPGQVRLPAAAADHPTLAHPRARRILATGLVCICGAPPEGHPEQCRSDSMTSTDIAGRSADRHRRQPWLRPGYGHRAEQGRRPGRRRGPGTGPARRPGRRTRQLIHRRARRRGRPGGRRPPDRRVPAHRPGAQRGRRTAEPPPAAAHLADVQPELGGQRPARVRLGARSAARPAAAGQRGASPCPAGPRCAARH